MWEVIVVRKEIQVQSKKIQILKMQDNNTSFRLRKIQRINT